MNSNCTNIADQMLENYDRLKSPFKWELDVSRWLVSLAYATGGKEVSTDEIKDMIQYSKKRVGLFSPFRSAGLFPLCSLLKVNSKTPEDDFDTMVENYKVMKSVGFKQTTYFPVALYTLNQAYKGNDPQGHLEKSMEIYKEMKANHPFLTGGDDYALAILLANESGKLDRIEAYYEALKQGGFSASNGLQMMSHILTFSDEPVKLVVTRCKEIADQLKANKLKVKTNNASCL